MSKHHTDTDKELEAVLGSHRTRIRIIGTGGAGNNTVTRLLEVGIRGVEVVAVNTDAQDLLYAKADHKILIGRNITNGLGAGSDPEKGAESARESVAELERMFNHSDMVFITCGLGGGTGTGSAPVIAELAKKSNALTIAIVTLPFSDEGIVRWENAKKGLEQLQQNVDTVIVVQNDRLLDLVPDMPLNSAFKVADEILVNAVKGITELVTEKGLVNLDFADVRTVMKDGGLAMIGLGECDEESKVEEAARQALQNPLLDIDVTGARSALINITGGPEMSLKSAKLVMKTISDCLDPNARLIWGTRVEESSNNGLRVMLIVTNLNGNNKASNVIKAQSESKQKQRSPQNDSETSQIDMEPAEPVLDMQADKTASQRSQNGSNVFSELFMEESEPDIIVLEEAIKGLTTDGLENNETFLRETRNACSAISGSAELFSYTKIAELADVVGDATASALRGDLDFNESVLGMLKQVPVVMRQMIEENESSFATAIELRDGFNEALYAAKPEVQSVEPSSEQAADEKEATDSHNDVEEEKEEPSKYFDKLF